MALWIIFAVMTAIAAVAVLRPFWRARMPSAAPSPDLEVYKEQLQEIEAETERGVLDQAEAEAARVEVSRRILAAADARSAQQHGSARAIVTPYVMAALLPIIALTLYMIYGSPNIPAQPFAAHLPNGGDLVEMLVARVEERLQRHPEDGMGWSVIAPVYVRLGRYADAVEAYRNAIRLLGDTADRSANLGEALALANEGAIDADARQAFAKAVSLDPANSKARFWSAISEEQAGRPDQAIAIYRKLLDGQLPDHVQKVVRERIALLEGGGQPQADAAVPKAGGGVDAAQINKMVSGLAERLKKDGSDLNGWLMLVRAYTVLGRTDDALTALKEARGQFAGNGEALGQIDALAKSLGLSS